MINTENGSDSFFAAFHAFSRTASRFTDDPKPALTPNIFLKLLAASHSAPLRHPPDLRPCLFCDGSLPPRTRRVLACLRSATQAGSRGRRPSGHLAAPEPDAHCDSNETPRGKTPCRPALNSVHWTHGTRSSMHLCSRARFGRGPLPRGLLIPRAGAHDWSDDRGGKARSALALCFLQAGSEDLGILISEANRLAGVHAVYEVVGQGWSGEPRQPGYGVRPSAPQKGGESTPLARRG